VVTENHRTSSGVWLVYYKVKSGKPSVRYSDAVKEALCFGWIDSKVKSLDEESYKQIFTPRKAKSVWSKVNKGYIEELKAQGLMTEAGSAKIEAAKADGSWNSLDEVEELTIPADLAEAFASDKIAESNFKNLSPSSRKVLLYRVNSAKRPETRAKRIAETVNSAAQNKRANFDR
jgi:uncharacterized protein YdeI (YjbR/CyaY-like superfamily)